MRGNRFFPTNNQGPARAGLFCREEAAEEAFGAGKGMKSCAEWECRRRPGRKMLIDSILFISLRDFSEKFI
jgi:hypothetical protein